MSDECRDVEIDGQVVRVRGDREMDDTDREMLAEVIKAAKRKLDTQLSTKGSADGKMDMNFETIAGHITRRQEIVDRGLGRADLDEYNILTLQLGEMAPTMFRALRDVVALRDELNCDDINMVSTILKAFAAEIDRALKGQRTPLQPQDATHA